MRIVFAGTPEVALPGLKALLAAGHQIVGVITRQDAPQGRKGILTPSPVGAYAEAQGLNVLKTNRPTAAETDWVAQLGADLGVVIAYGGLLKQDLLHAPRLGWVNMHFSKLPAWRGAAPVQRAIMAGETNIGVSIFRLVEALDAGPVVAYDEWNFESGTTSGEVLHELAELGAKPLLAALDDLGVHVHAGKPQTDETRLSYAHKLTRQDGKLDFELPAGQVLARWAGTTPEPGAWATHDDAVIKIIELADVAELADAAGLAPGEVRLVSKKALVGTGTAPLILKTVQPASKKPMPAADWLRGVNVRADADERVVLE